MSFKPLIPASLAYTDAGVPCAPAYGDVYHSADGGLEQARHVFLGGNDLPALWRGQRHFTILETGFGLGLNFLATWQAWREDLQRPARLHFVSVEKHPFERESLSTLHAGWPELKPLADELQARWPPLTPGVHRLLLEGGQVSLTLFLGDATELLPRMVLTANAIYLDGFAPAKNPEMWSRHLLHGLGRLAAPGATLATWSVASAVRENLAHSGWILEQRPGFGRKRNMLCASRVTYRGAGQSLPSLPEHHAMVIGAGIAGASIAESLARRGWQVEVLEKAPAPATAASGNPAGLLHPVLTSDDNITARLTRAGYFFTLALLRRLMAADPGLPWHIGGILQLARDSHQEADQAAVVEQLGLPCDFVRYVDRSHASALAGLAISHGGWFWPEGAWGNPGALCKALLARHGSRVSLRCGVAVAHLDRDRSGRWIARDAAGNPLACAATVVIATAHEAVSMLPAAELNLPLLRGQLTILPALPEGRLNGLAMPICGNGYVTPALEGAHCLGATFDSESRDPEPDVDGHRQNLARLHALLPALDTTPFDPHTLAGRVGFRTVTRDRLPLAGAMVDASQFHGQTRLDRIPRLEGLHILAGLGSRGLCWAPLAAELIASRIEHEPLPVERDLAVALDPGRFLLRAARRGSASSPDANIDASMDLHL
ncbi:MAG: bifunctional tRNA (5-methylaminomethyl-2-thiouridine)(34)-methyltransferase MnmD/FAD-dependent 5-carboxymethylaminomethyl-2-thiouridine(34) oxidoreductase MnmC [Proteobacteria bacterium]|nr:bifunctional tRNA (5-methylaminomethyl-2-thiouridine)(34)-methyltransferase MnmD/FAD-dependent 5-carboxymethylaminomethyl-2-thiouridine(34) oxidoreductase MnmC [Pseudomonadota bacterium]HQR02688.1 bifunctional tRNA (5-methylaminomethyl-2-thiouridine)(34)-methyltransferase MnmD/FAD-dependent 5-carboxymethylaminomethyl-2-thiouridine(34) oxidoreductase MnmC [Rhodocyclaceae bacterium]